jgi:hypothetical protein
MADGMVEIEILSKTYVPADHGQEDARQLGVVLSRVTFAPTPGTP